MARLPRKRDDIPSENSRELQAYPLPGLETNTELVPGSCNGYQMMPDDRCAEVCQKCYRGKTGTCKWWSLLQSRDQIKGGWYAWEVKHPVWISVFVLMSDRKLILEWFGVCTFRYALRLVLAYECFWCEVLNDSYKVNEILFENSFPGVFIIFCSLVVCIFILLSDLT